MKRRALTFVMLLIGALSIAGGVLAFVPNELLPLGKQIGQESSVAAIALGTGLCVAAFRPTENISWVRIGILYGVLVVAYEIVASMWLGVGFGWLPTVFGVATVVLLIGLYPSPETLVPSATGEPSGLPHGSTS
jgi:hypothetical protein